MTWLTTWPTHGRPTYAEHDSEADAEHHAAETHQLQTSARRNHLRSPPRTPRAANRGATMTTAHTLDIHDHVEQLTRSHTHREPYSHRNGLQISIFTHLTMVPPLIDQLDEPNATAKGDVGGSSGYSSRPAASIEAIDTLMFIDDEAARWVRKLGEDDPGDTKACINRVHALHASQQPAVKADIERAVKRWWSQARITSGWDSPAWRPDNTCPVCEQRRSLRIKLADQMGFCVECRSMWDPTEIGLLADWIRLENAEDATPAETEEAS